MTAPPLLADRIEYEPAPPYWREQLTQRAPMGSVIKCRVIYDEPFWRAEGLSGQATGDGEGSRVVFDNSRLMARPESCWPSLRVTKHTDSAGKASRFAVRP